MLLLLWLVNDSAESLRRAAEPRFGLAFSTVRTAVFGVIATTAL